MFFESSWDCPFLLYCDYLIVLGDDMFKDNPLVWEHPPPQGDPLLLEYYHVLGSILRSKILFFMTSCQEDHPFIRVPLVQGDPLYEKMFLSSDILIS